MIESPDDATHPQTRGRKSFASAHQPKQRTKRCHDGEFRNECANAQRSSNHGSLRAFPFNSPIPVLPVAIEVAICDKNSLIPVALCRRLRQRALNIFSHNSLLVNYLVSSRYSLSCITDDTRGTHFASRFSARSSLPSRESRARDEDCHIFFLAGDRKTAPARTVFHVGATRRCLDMGKGGQRYLYDISGGVGE